MMRKVPKVIIKQRKEVARLLFPILMRVNSLARRDTRVVGSKALPEIIYLVQH
jgi:hypothetical protein